MTWLDSLRIAGHGLTANALRSALTVLGLLIGVGAVIMLIAVGNGSSQQVQQRIEALGTNTLTVLSGRFGFGGGRQSQLGTSTRSTSLTLDDVRALQDRANAPDIQRVAPVVNASGATASYQGATYTPQQLQGTTPDYLKIRNLHIADGAAFTAEDEQNHRRVVLLGQTVATNLFGSQNPVGVRIKLGGSSWDVVGLLAPRGSNGLQDQDDVVIAPLSAVRDNLTGHTDTVNSITVEAESRDVMDATSSEITSTLNANHRITNPSQSSFLVLNQGALLDTSNQTSSVFTTLLGAVAAISLLVGGIGVMNIMLVSVTERTREIGIRKAVGARHLDIMMQFLIEAMLLSVVGGVLGIVAGLVGSQFEVIGVQPVVVPGSVILAFGVAVGVGLFFGIYPANRAASLRPIEALRHE
jgi:putative ABC transport system permease protein